MTAGIVGLGLIGGSFAKAYHEKKDRVLAYDINRNVTDFAKMSGAVDDDLTKENMAECDIILVCIYPNQAVEWLEENGPYIGKETVVIDSCGTKRDICEKAFEIADKYGFTYAGGHPMAGTHNSGFKYSSADMLEGAPMVITPKNRDDIELLAHIKELLEAAGFGTISVTTPEEHDEVIAFTSQLAHVVSSAYIKSPTAKHQKGFSAGSYKDMTRVAKLEPEMWTQLFLENKDNLAKELDCIIENLNEYKNAVESADREKLKQLLEDGRQCKIEAEGPLR